MESKELAIRLARALDAKKAVNVHILAVEDLTTVTEYFVIATGMSTTHVGALADEAEFQLVSRASSTSTCGRRPPCSSSSTSCPVDAMAAALPAHSADRWNSRRHRPCSRCS